MSTKAIKAAARPAPITGRWARGTLWALLTLWALTVTAIVFAPVRVDDNAAGGALDAWLAQAHSNGLPEWINHSSIEQTANMVMFMPGGFALCLLLGWRFWMLYAGFIVSAAIEIIQFFMPERVGDWHDVLTNGTGLALGALAGWAVLTVRSRRLSTRATSSAAA
ncbi:MAG: VanZ family protein [Rothia sp. (in: high G+C Gram-positive bacteria)]|uniref:VanZ family protein n=1 Tax=Rothia sp. (in: high G+C Gram-positive bacteria) TaxID=1885016 RepID=UPI0026DFF5F7|nr:VanZ family protein [Rothia sp. (in: high G+C Gram-positive bacteria)]MDO5749802.1 VanZ family protein [Rothia sp. (in: high G+C Gram-positive bacteria)]